MAKEHLIIALDVSSRQTALDLVRILKDHVGWFKVGLQLFTSSGPDIVTEILRHDCKVFLDLKLHDIPNTVSHAVSEALQLGAQMLTLHTTGGEQMLRGARDAVEQHRATGSHGTAKLLGVTILTSMDQIQSQRVGFSDPIEDLVLRLAHLADDCDLDGIVCSPWELERLREEGFKKLFFVTPGIRPEGSKKDDQSRIMTAGEAILRGARYLVVGRPITQAADPAAAAQALLSEMEDARIRGE